MEENVITRGGRDGEVKVKVKVKSRTGGSISTVYEESRSEKTTCLVVLRIILLNLETDRLRAIRVFNLPPFLSFFL